MLHLQNSGQGDRDMACSDYMSCSIDTLVIWHVTRSPTTFGTCARVNYALQPGRLYPSSEVSSGIFA